MAGLRAPQNANSDKHLATAEQAYAQQYLPHRLPEQVDEQRQADTPLQHRQERNHREQHHRPQCRHRRQQRHQKRNHSKLRYMEKRGSPFLANKRPSHSKMLKSHANAVSLGKIRTILHIKTNLKNGSLTKHPAEKNKFYYQTAFLTIKVRMN